MQHLPFLIPLLFILITFCTISVFYFASGKQSTLLVIFLCFLVIQAILGLMGFFTQTEGIPPRLAFLVAPPFLLILGMFIFKKGHAYLDRFDIATLTILHSIRVGIEIILYALFLYKAVPGLMTFEGRNLDIISGLTAPLVYYFGYKKRKLSNRAILTWNILCLAILLVTVITAILSAPTPIQQWAFDQPMIAILYFPFVWLPGIIVPIVILSHFTAIRTLSKTFQSKKQQPVTLAT
jgi:uncharacterized membrane protein